VHSRLARLLGGEDDVAVTEPVVMELLAGVRSRRDLIDTRRLLLNLRMLRVGGLDTYERAAAISRLCRAQGDTVRRGIDCLIASVAIRDGVSILHMDRDFDVIARHTDLRIEPVA
jgi:predicted nucleic acid-binding protein